MSSRGNAALAHLGSRDGLSFLFSWIPVSEGKRIVEGEIQSALNSGNIVDAEDSLGEYASALEAARDWHAIAVLRRDVQLRV